MRDIGAGVPILGVTGINGAGKTLLAVSIAVQRMRAGRRVLSTVQIASPATDRHIAVASEPIETLTQLLELRDVTVLLDEIAVVFSSRASSSVPHEFVTLLQVLRHRDVDVIWTAPSWARCDILLRSVTQGLLNVVPMMRVSDGSPWPRPRLIMAGLLDTSQGKVDDTPTKVLRRVVVRPTSLPGWGAYDSKADTPMLAQHVHSATCPDCGGSVTKPKHDEDRHRMLGLPWRGPVKSLTNE